MLDRSLLHASPVLNRIEEEHVFSIVCGLVVDGHSVALHVVAETHLRVLLALLGYQELTHGFVGVASRHFHGD
jgi:hypothetical protein